MINTTNSHRKKFFQRFVQASMFIFTLIVILILVPGKADVYGGDAKYIILFIADGWGKKHVEATNSYTGTTPIYQQTTEDSNPNTWTEHWLSTYNDGEAYDTGQAWSNFNYVTEPNIQASADCATALYTGNKTANRRISVSTDASVVLQAISDIAKDAGKSSGAVSTVPVSHATPGAWIAHNDDRGNTFAIADEGLFGDPNYTGTVATDPKYAGGHGVVTTPTDVVIGSDGSSFVSNQIRFKLSTYDGMPGRHVFIDKLSGETVADMLSAANNTSTKQLAALFDHAYKNADNTGYDPSNPTLSESTDAALKVLNRNPNGFVLMVEGGAIDWAAHSNNMNQMVGEAIEFDNAIQTVIDWVNDSGNGSNWSNTLVVVTGDHECGQLAASGGFITDPSDPRYDPNDPYGSIGPVNATTLSMEEIISGGGGRRASWTDCNGNGLIDTNPAGTTCDINCLPAGCDDETVFWQWNTGGHSNALIPLYARGTGADHFVTMEQTAPTDTYRGKYLHSSDVFSAMINALSTGACIETGTISIIPGQSMYGNPIDLSLLVSESNTANLNYTVEDNSSVVCPEQNNEVLLNQGDNWKYDIENSGSNWKNTGYDDTSWSSGNGVFGYEPDAGDTNHPYTISTPLGDPSSTSLFFRNTFTVCDNSAVTGLTLNSLFDDGIAVYINGTQVYTKNTAGDPPHYIDGATGGHEANNYEPKDLASVIGIEALRDLLVSGTNVIAVGVYNNNYPSDIVWDGGLTISSSETREVIYDSLNPSVDTSLWTEGLKTLLVSGDDTACLSPLEPVSDTFTFYTSAASSDTLIASNNTSIAASATEGETGIVMQRFQVDSSNIGDSQVVLSLLSIVDDGSFNNIADAKIYISPTSSSTLPGDEVQIGSTGPWDGAPATITLTGSAAIRTVTSGNPKYIYIVYDLPMSGAGESIQSRVSSISVGAPDIGAGTIGVSNPLPITACTITGSIAITPGQTLNGNPIDLTSIVTTSNASNLVYDLVPEAASACEVDTAGTYIEAELYNSTIPPTTGNGTFSFDNSQAGFIGSGYIVNSGTYTRGSCPSADEGKSYQLTFSQAGTYKVWVRGYGLDGNSDSFFVGVNGNCTGVLNMRADGVNWYHNQWKWTNNIQSGVNTITIPEPGVHTVNIWMREPNFKIDGIYLTQGAETPSFDSINTPTFKINPIQCAAITGWTGNEAQAQSFNTTTWANGAYVMTITGTDAVCLDQLAGASETFTFDINSRPTSEICTTASTDPSCTGVTLTNGDTLTSNDPNPYIFKGTASDVDSNVNHIEISINGGAWFALPNSGEPGYILNEHGCVGCAGGDVTWYFSWPLPANDEYTIVSRAVDQDGAIEIPGPGITVTVQTGNPVVSSTIPSDGALVVVPDSTVTINWDRDVDCLTVDETSVTILPSVGWSKTSCSEAEAIFTPSGQAQSTSYTVTVSAAVTDSTGNPMAVPYQFSYTTGELTDPTSVITDPLDGGKINSNAPDPYIISGTANDNDIVQSVEIRINGGAWTAVTTCTGCGTDSVTWTYDWDLPADGFYTIESRATDASNNAETPAAPITVEVDTTSPSVSSTNPVNGATAVALNQSVSITWNTNVNCSTVNTGTIISNAPNWTLFVCAGNSATFTTTGQTEYALYTVTVKSGAAGVKSSTGVEMSDDYVFTYRTNKAPSLAINEPNGNDSVKAGQAFNIIYTFNDPDHNPTVNFFYDTNTDMTGGSPIAGDCTGAAEGTNATCTWNISSGMTPGNYYIYGVTNDGHGEVKALSGVLTIYPPNQPPVLSISEPNGTDDTVVDGDIYSITYTLTDANVDDTITVDFFYDTDNQNYNGIPITGACSSAPEGTGVTCGWNTVGLSPGTYYIYGITNGDLGGPVQAYSSGPVTVNTANTVPSLTILQPDGVNDSVTEGDNYSITYNLSDSDDLVTVDFYYDNNNSGVNGTPLSGSCASAPEGTGVTCTWNTTGMPAGSYYIYGITSGDRNNTIIVQYSLGPITIVVNAPAVSSTAPADSSAAIAPDSAVTITWDENVNCATVTTSSVTILPAPTTWTKTSCSGNQAVFTPAGQTDTTLYEVTVSTAVQDTEGNGMTAPHVFSYTTNNPPALDISIPDGSEDPQTAGNSFSIEYSLTDNDHEVTAALYYDTDSDMSGGTPIPGCEAVVEGTNINCTWTGIPAGTYYVYGVSDDGVGSGGGGSTCTSRTWNGANTIYTTGSNWNPTGAPQDGDDVAFNGTSTVDSVWDTNVALTSLSINTGYTGTVTVNSALSISEDLIISDGKIVVGSGSITVGSAPVSCGNSSSFVAGPVTILPAGITVTPTSGLVTTEAGGSDTFTIVLNSQPTANVTIGLSSSDLTEGTVAPASLTFTPVDWNIPQTVTVTGVDDSLIDGDVIYTIITAPAVSADAYNGVNADDVSVVTNSDDDSATVIVTPASGLVTTEAGGTATFTAALSAQPTADVTIGLSSSDLTEGTVAPASLTFTAGNWNVPQTVTVTGVNDEVADGSIGYSVIIAPAVSTDSEYSGVDADDVTVTNNDNDTANIIVTPTSGLVTDENGTSDTFTIALNSQPTADVTIGLSSSNTAEGTVSPTSLTFTSANWNTPQTVTVTGEDDLVADGSTGYSILTAPAVSADTGYNGMDAADVSVTNSDNEVVGITVTPTSGLVTDESGGTDTFTVVLTSPPAADVTIGLSSSNTAEGTVSPASLTFTAGNWYIAQTATVTGVNDSVQDGNIAYNILTAAAVSGDPAYSGLNASDVSVTNTDNDVAGITVSPLSIITTEDSGVASFWMKLDSQPTADVTIGISSSDTSEGTVSISSWTFTSANWNTKKFVTVTGVDDNVADGNITFSILTAAAVSGDGNYNGMDAADVSVTNMDNDVVGITVTPISGLVTDEDGGTATFTVVLDSEPASDVTIGLSSSDLTEGTVDSASLIFTAANWNTAQTVTVTGVDDSVQDGNIAYTIVTAPAVSADAYNGFNPDDVSVTNNDNGDTAGITVGTISGNTTEGGGTATFTVVLNSQPTADVIIGISSNDTTEGTVLPLSLTFTAGNWNVPQTVTVTGADDFIIDGNIGYSIVTAAAVSMDGNYSAMNAADVSVINNDNDVAGITVSTISGDTTEAGGTATFTVELDSEPTADVIISMSSNDTTEGTVLPLSLTFTAGSWNVPQTVTVTGVDDFVIDGDVLYTIETSSAGSTDTDYNGLPVADVSVTNIDDDVIGITVTPISGNTTEAGGTATFTVKLNSEPAEDVSIGISSDDTTEGTVSPASLTFTAANWNTPQTVTVTGEDDYVVDGNIVYTIITAAASSLDTNYDGQDASDVSVTNDDDDVAGITVSAISGNTTEAGGTATFTIELDSEPTADVTIGLSSSNTDEGTVSPISLTFTSANWNVPQTVTVTGVDDNVQDGNQSFSIITAQATSTDPNYSAINPADVAVTNNDDDVADITVSAISGNTTEGGGSATFTVVLDSEPTADVTIGLSSSNTDEGTVSPLSLTFTAGNWNVPQTGTVTGVDDWVDDGDQPFSIITAQAASTDTNYSAINPADVSVTNTDNDTAGIYVNPTSGLTTSEAGTQNFFSVTLESQPTDDVTITLSSNDPGEGIIIDPSPATLTFTPSNWDLAQWVTVEGVPDGIVDGNVLYQIETAPATSPDVKYNGMDAADVNLTNFNID